MDHHEAIRDYYAAYRNRDKAALKRLLAPDCRFVSAYGEYGDRDAMLEEIWPSVGLTWATGLRIYGKGPDFVVLYEHARTPEMTQPAMRMAEHIGFEGDRIASIEVFVGRALEDE